MPHTIKPRSGIVDISPYVGGDITPQGYTRRVALSSNENPLGPGERVIEKIQALASEVYKYPRGSSPNLRGVIADFHKLDAEQILCTNGSEAALSLLIRTFAGPGDEVLMSQYSFAFFEIAAKASGATAIKAPAPKLRLEVDNLLAYVTHKTKVVLIDNPSNPIGTYLSRSEIVRLREALPDHVLLVLDSAYAEYVLREDYSDGIDLVQANDNIVMTRTFSKFYGMAGLRIGWFYGPAYIVDYINRVRTPFCCNLLAQHAGIAALEDTKHQQMVRDHFQSVHPWFSVQLKDLGLKFTPSVTNFILVEFPVKGMHTAEATYLSLAEKGYIVRPLVPYGLMHYLRITIGLRKDMEGVVQTLRSFLGASLPEYDIS